MGSDLLTWRDLLDIFAVSLFFYGILKLLKLTRGMSIARGIAILGVFWLFAEILELKTLSWMFEKIWAVGIFSLVVIFQPEIRKALGKLGQRGALSQSRKISEMVIDRVVRACSLLSERQIGALVVIERSQNLESILESCIHIDAILSSELIITIFNPISPLHDGAVVVRGDRLLYASCILPLSRSTDIPRKYGTRHRAGVGITEESDAICVIVSEETGEMSLAVSGKLSRNLDQELLRALLMKELLNEGV
ncbi:MAG: diadenylate cyclase CdaA [Aquificaceae bacterium]|nr:diadenylate cyclase CdaA [Aquificaceae bacterium]